MSGKISRYYSPTMKFPKGPSLWLPDDTSKKIKRVSLLFSTLKLKLFFSVLHVQSQIFVRWYKPVNATKVPHQPSTFSEGKDYYLDCLNRASGSILYTYWFRKEELYFAGFARGKSKSLIFFICNISPVSSFRLYFSVT